MTRGAYINSSLSDRFAVYYVSRACIALLARFMYIFSPGIG